MYENLRKLAADCVDVSAVMLRDKLAHRFVLLDANAVRVAGGDPDGVTVKPWGMSVNWKIADIHAAMDAVLWEDHHCATCCNVLGGVVEIAGTGLRVICEAPKLVGASAVSIKTDRLGT